ncbi:hypothetical protein OCU04_006234 [Sclerotinia nivalis]|uniref:Uncharacterized protein n=1 Tax=Sclerotinia nivalis TaxID=352851 RepID=A0A9X0AMN2_9HELO|nr:hypothetical protein OCU04_006234 [Sclerotinia nivalis]
MYMKYYQCETTDQISLPPHPSTILALNHHQTPKTQLANPHNPTNRQSLIFQCVPRRTILYSSRRIPPCNYSRQKHPINLNDDRLKLSPDQTTTSSATGTI